MALLSGDSLAVGLAAYIHHVKVDARVGRRSAEGAAIIRRYPDDTVYVSLGANDSDRDTAAFRRRVKLVVRGRECVAWLQIPRHPRLTHVLRTTPGVKVVSIAGVHRSDGIHPTAEGYRVLARRMEQVCDPPTEGRGGVPENAPELPPSVPGVPSVPLPKLPPLPPVPPLPSVP
jgi:hypothetical protein